MKLIVAIGLVVALMAAATSPASATTLRSCPRVDTPTGPAVFHDGAVRVRNLHCQRARKTLRAFALKRVTDYDTCWLPAKGDGACYVAGFSCSLTEAHGGRLNGLCILNVDNRFTIRFVERQEDELV